MTTLHLSAPSLRSRIPSHAGATIRRRRLLDDLDRAGETRAVSLLTAPAGSGKTMLLVDWIESKSGSDGGPIAWLTIEESDNDVAALRACIVATFAQAGNPELTSAIETLPSVDDAGYSNFSALLVEALESVDEHITLILDDSHLLHDNDVLALLGNFLRWPPRNVRTIIAGRFEPPLALQKLRLDGLVHDITASAIAFTTDEATEMFARSGTVLEQNDLTKLMNRTEGWAAGLRLAGMTLAGSHRPSEVIDAFTGTQHTVADYLVGEVLSYLPTHVRTFLIETSVPDWFTTDLAERLTGEHHAQDIIDSLVAQNFFIDRIPGPERAYRYHPLMRGYLRAEIARLGAEQIRNLERVASSWFNDYRQPLKALQHSVHAGDWPTVVDILCESGLGLVLRGDGAQVLATIERASTQVRHHAISQLISAAAFLAEGKTAPAVSILSILRRSAKTPVTEQTPRGDLDAEMLRRVLEVHASIYMGNVADPLARVKQLDIGRSGSPTLDSYTLMVTGLAELQLGRTTDAVHHLIDATDNARAGNLHLTALSCLSITAGTRFLAAEFDETLETAHETIDYAQRHGMTDSPLYSVAQSLGMLVAVIRMTPCPVDSPEAVWSAISRSPDPAVADYGRRASWALHTPTSRLGHDDREWLEFDRPSIPGFEALLAPMIQRRYLASGEVHRATELVEVTARRLGRVGEVGLLAAEIHRLHGRLDAAENELSSVVDGSRHCINPVTSVRAYLAAASMAASRKHPIRAFDMVVRALTAAEPESILLPFAEAGPSVRDILTHNHGRFGLLESFADRARACVPPGSRSIDRPATGTLTRRELELLRELPSWRTAEQIAADHFVSVNTIKTHLRGIYRKLEVRSRRDAIAAAHELGLL